MQLSIHFTPGLQGCIFQYIRLLYYREPSFNILAICITGMHLSIHYNSVLQGCISLYIRFLYYRDASLCTLDFCITGMHLSVHTCIHDYFVLRTISLMQIRRFALCIPEQLREGGAFCARGIPQTLEYPGIYVLVGNTRVSLP